MGGSLSNPLHTSNLVLQAHESAAGGDLMEGSDLREAEKQAHLLEWPTASTSEAPGEIPRSSENGPTEE